MSYSINDARTLIEKMGNHELGKYRDALAHIGSVEGAGELSRVPTSEKLRIIQTEIKERTDAVNFFCRYDHRSH